MTRQGSFSLQGIRSALAKSRQLVLWITIVITFQGIGGPEVLYARQTAVQQAAQQRAAVLLSVGVPFDKLPPPPPSRLAETGRWMEAELGAALGKIKGWATAAQSWAATWKWQQGAALDTAAAPARPRPYGNGGMPPPESVDGREHGPARSLRPRARAAEAGAAGLESSLPLRRIERRARIQEVGALAPSLEHSSAIAPPAAAPRRITAEAAPAPEIAALAESLGRAPGRIFRFVHDTIDYEPQWGADAPPLGTLWEGRGTSWEQAWLLQDLLVAAGVDARLEWGEVEISPAMLQDLTGVEDLFRAGDLLTTGGIAVVLQVQAGHVVAARLPHVWVKAWLDYAPNRGATPGTGDTWIRMDPTLKRFDEAYGARVDDAVSFALGPYLQSGTEVTPRATYEQALTTYATDQNLGTVEDLKPRRAVTADAFPFVPGTLRARIVSVAGEAQAIPEGMQQRLSVEVLAGDGVSLLTWSAAAPQLWGRRLEIAWPGASASDQATLDLYGGVFATPPYEVDLKPSVRLDGVEVAAGTEVGSAEDVELRATITPPNGVQTFAVWEMFAGEHGVLSLAFGDIPQQVVDRFAQQQATATHFADAEAWGLARAAATYLHALAGDYRHLAALRWHRQAILGAAVLAVQRGAVSTASDGTPVTFAEGPLSIDVGAMPLALVPAQGPLVSTVPSLELLGSQGSVREGEALATAFGGEHVTAVGFLTRAAREGQTLTRIDGTNLDAALAAAELSAEAEGTIRFGVGQGLIAWIPRTQIEIGGWQTTGYVMENPASGAGAYLVTFERKVPLGETAVEFHAPLDLAEVTAPTEVVATINADNLQSWSLATRPSGEGATTIIATGTGPVDNAVLGTFDPTLLLNGLHDLVLTGTTAAGKTVTGRISVVVEGGMKIGNFSLSFVDLAVPLSGLAIEIVRTYDSRDKRQGDFGYGWSLDVRQGSYRNNRKPGEGWQILKGFLPCQQASETKSHLTTIRLSDREVYRFQPVLSRTGIQGGGCIATAAFRFVDGPVPGATLTILGPDQVFWANGTNSVVDPDSQEVFEPQAVRLTTRDGRVFDLDLGQGVTRLSDADGNELTITDSGITHTSGQSIAFERDADGRITEITDPAGSTISYVYDASGDLRSMTNRENKQFSYRYSPVHYLSGITNADGREVLTAEFDTEGRVERKCDADLNCARVVRDIDRHTEQRIDATNRVTTLRYDDRGNVVSVTDGLNHETRYEYNDRDQVTKKIDAAGAVTTWTYNASGDLLAVTLPHRPGEDPAAFTTTMTYDSDGLQTSLASPDGGSWTAEYDDAGNLLVVKDGAGRVLEGRTYVGGALASERDRFGTSQYLDLNQFGQPSRAVDPNGKVTTAEYGSLGKISSMTSPAGTWTFQHDRLGQQTRADYGNGFVVQNEYDEFGRMVSQTSPVAGSLGRRFDLAGNLEAWELPGGTEVTYQRDASGRVTGFSDPLGRTTTYGYDAAGHMNRVVDPATGELMLELDAVGRVTKTTDALGHETRLGYYPDGRLEWQRDHDGRESSFRYGPGFSEATDPLSRTIRTEVGSEGELTRVVFPDDSEQRFEYLAGVPQGESDSYPTLVVDEAGAERRFSYDTLGRLASATDLAGETWAYSASDLSDRETVTSPLGEMLREDMLDVYGRLVSRRFGDNSVYQLGYTLGSNPTRLTKPSGLVIDLAYDTASRLTSRSSTSGETETFSWNAAGDLLSHTDATGTRANDYDPSGRLSSITQGDGARVEYGYDAVGRVTSVFVRGPGAASGSMTTYRYDTVGNLVEISDPVAGITTFEHDAARRVTRRGLANGVTTDWGYDDRDRILSVVHRRGDSSVLASFVYTRGNRGEIFTATREDGSRITYDYDDALRLTLERREAADGSLISETSYAYDAAGNRTSHTTNGVIRESSYLPGLRLSQVSAAGIVEETYTWDGDGRIATSTRQGTTWTYGYDSKDALRSVADGLRTVAYGHDAEGRRVSASDGTTMRRFLMAPVLAEGLDTVHLATDGASTSVFVWAGSQPLARVDGGASVRYFLTDGLGSVIGLVDSSGQLAARSDYDAFGNVISASGEPVPQHLGGALAFHGQWREEATGLYHLRARDYDPVTGRFLSRDQGEADLFAPESLHPYVFANGNPLMFSDPTGLFGFSVAEVNVTISMDSMLNAIKTQALNHLRQRVIEKIGEALTEFLFERLLTAVGIDLGDTFSVAGISPSALGSLFERAVGDALCGWMPKGSGLYFEAGVRASDGRPVSDGFGCEGPSGGIARKKGVRYPDFLLRPAGFRPTNMARKTLITGEVKLGVGSFYRAWFSPGRQKNQWRAIHRHARSYGYLPHAVILVALRKGTNYQENYIVQQAVFEGVFGALMTVF